MTSCQTVREGILCHSLRHDYGWSLFKRIPRFKKGCTNLSFRGFVTHEAGVFGKNVLFVDCFIVYGLFVLAIKCVLPGKALFRTAEAYVVVS